MEPVFLNTQEWQACMTAIMQLQFNFGVVCGIDAVLKGAPEAHHEAVGRGRATALAEIKSIYAAFNQTSGKEMNQVLVDHYPPAADWFERLRPEIDAAPLNAEKVAYYAGLYRSILAREIPQGDVH